MIDRRFRLAGRGVGFRSGVMMRALKGSATGPPVGAARQRALAQEASRAVLSAVGRHRFFPVEALDE